MNKYLIRYFFSTKYPKGFQYLPNFITEGQQLKIREILDKNKWCEHLRRHQQYYGIKYFQTKYSDSFLQNLYSVDHGDISQFDFVIHKIKQSTSFFCKQSSPNQVLVNKYLKKDYLGLHVEDTDAFGDVIMGLSIGNIDYLRLSPAIKQEKWKQTPMQHYKNIDSSNQIKVRLQNRSLYILSGECRYQWRHGIGRSINGISFKENDFMRISLTIRDVLQTRRKIKTNQQQ